MAMRFVLAFILALAGSAAFAQSGGGGAGPSGPSGGSTQSIFPLGIDITKNLNMTGSATNPANSALYWFGTVTGNCTASCVANVLGANSWANTGTNAGSVSTNTRVYTNLGGAGQVGGFLNFDTTLFINQTTGNTTNAFYQAFNSGAFADHNDNGTPGAEKGSLFGMGNYCVLRNGATSWLAVGCSEHDLSIQTGANALYAGGVSVVLLSDNAVAASRENFGFLVGAQTGAVPTLDCAYCIGGYQGVNPMAAGGSLMAFRPNGGAGSGPTITAGIDLTKFTFTGNAFSSTGFSVNGSGNTVTPQITTPTILGSGAGGPINLGFVTSAFNGLNVVPSTGANPVYLQTTANALVLRAQPAGGAVQIANAAGGVAFQSGNDSNVATSTNYWDFHGVGTGTGVVYASAAGADANIGMNFRCKGSTCEIRMAGNGIDVNSNSSFAVLGTASAVNRVTVNGNVTGSGPTVAAAGSDTNINLNLTGKGTGGVTLPNITTDATHTTSTICQDTTSHQLYFGSGTIGICLGTSSARFKHAIEPLAAGLDQIMKLEPVSYKLNEDHGDPDKVLYGFTAEQGGKALPALAGTDTEGKPNTFDYLGVVPVLVKGMQQLKAENDNLRACNDNWKCRLFGVR